MDLNKNNMKKILFIIFLGILFYTAIGHLNIIYGAIRQIISLLFPHPFRHEHRICAERAYAGY